MIDTKQPSRGSDQFPLRLPDGMRDKLKSAAEKEGRSMNAEIVSRLDDYPKVQWNLLAALEREGKLKAEVGSLTEKVGRAEQDRRLDQDALERHVERIAELEATVEFLQTSRGQLMSEASFHSARADGAKKELERVETATAEKVAALERDRRELRETIERMEAEANKWADEIVALEAHKARSATIEKVLEARLEAAQQDRLDEAGRVDWLRRELKDTQTARDDALSRAQMLEKMWDLLRLMDSQQKEDRSVLEEVEEIAKFLEGDLLALHVELRGEQRAVAPSPARPTSMLAERITDAIDGRTIRLVNLVARLTDGDEAMRRALVFAHSVTLPDAAREICQMYVDSGPGTAEEFYDYVEQQVAGAPDEEQEAHMRAARSAMPIIFRGWEARPTPSRKPLTADRTTQLLSGAEDRLLDSNTRLFQLAREAEKAGQPDLARQLNEIGDKVSEAQRRVFEIIEPARIEAAENPGRAQERLINRPTEGRTSKVTK